MRILLVGNYALDRQESMLRFATLLQRELAARGHFVTLLQPRPVFGSKTSGNGFAKWLGYIDKFILFPFTLRRTLRDFDVVHLCDHSNSMYTRHLARSPNVVTCHDVLAITSALGEVAENRVSATGRKLQQMILTGLKAAQNVVCVSSLTQSEMLRVTGREPQSSEVVYTSLNYPYTPMPREQAQTRLERLGFDLNTPYFLHVGGASWYKNRAALLRIFDHLQRLPEHRGKRLLLIGQALEPELLAFIRTAELEHQVIRLHSLSNDDLRAAYSLAEALIFPSLQEGFGWPILEAQACGCPVFATNREPMTEVGGNGAVYFDPTSPVRAAEVIAAALPRREQLCRSGFDNLQRFTVDRMIDGYISAYQRVTATR